MSSDLFGFRLIKKKKYLLTLVFFYLLIVYEIDHRSGGFESLQDEINLVQDQLTSYILQEETAMENRIK